MFIKNFFTKKKLEVPVSNERKQVDVVKLWIVTWKSYNSVNLYSIYDVKQYEAFTSEEAANEFAESLKNAHILLRNVGAYGCNAVKVYTKESDPV